MIFGTNKGWLRFGAALLALLGLLTIIGIACSGGGDDAETDTAGPATATSAPSQDADDAARPR